jgi:dTDP-glucose pyrophosphorylase
MLKNINNLPVTRISSKFQMYRKATINSTSTMLDALKKMDYLNKKLLIVLESEKFKGLLSAGDIQRAIIQNKPFDTAIKNVLRTKIKIAHPGDSFESIKDMMFKFRMELCPVVDKNGEIVTVHFWEDIFQEKAPKPRKMFNLPVVIMAGGFGTRMKPLTNVLPKPLIPLNDKTMLEEIFDRFALYGCIDFYVSVNYKAELIEYYINNLNLNYNISFFKELKPLGTAGSLSMIKEKINKTFFLSNCDILIEQDYSEILDYHFANNNIITVVAALKHYPIPYGTIETGENGQLIKLTEKPEITYKINSGMYILDPVVLKNIPSDEFFHITDLINNVINDNGNVGVFPVSEGSWKDIGEWDSYIKLK